MYYAEERTLQEIGDEYGVTRERVRQLMEAYGLPRDQRRRGGSLRFLTLGAYFNLIRGGLKESAFFLNRLIPKNICKECSGTKCLHIHHLRYPAISLDDIQILCAPCHTGKHKKGNGILRQRGMYKDHLAGYSVVEIAKKYNVTTGNIYRFLRKFIIRRRSYRYNF